MRRYLFIWIFVCANCLSTSFQLFSQVVPADYSQRNAAPIVLRGTIITPQGVIKHGYVALVNGRIASVSDKQPDLPGAIDVNTHGIILPGFVDVHNHIIYNVLPRWKPRHLYTNRSQWRSDPEHIQLVGRPIDDLRALHFCDMNTWGELRALVGGTTSIMATQSKPCIHGLVRNLDFNSGFYGTTELNLEHILNVIDLPPADSVFARATFVRLARLFIVNPQYEALFLHLAEGTDEAAEEEFTFVQKQSLLNPKGVIIHGIPLNAANFHSMAEKGTALVWSPRSNLELYGHTANIDAALDEGVEIALAPDWAVTGSSNMLDELKVAAEWNHGHLGDRLTYRQLVDMTTSIPAHIAGIDDEVGALAAGLRADILVINGDHNDAYQSVVDATPSEVELVFIDGVPLYGDRIFMERFWKRSELEEINLPDATKTLATPAATIRVADIESRLTLALGAEGVSLAPLTETNVADQIISTTLAPHMNRDGAQTDPGKLKVTVMPNPSRENFSLFIQSSSNEEVQLKILDALGRIVEVRKGFRANTTFRAGDNARPGIYLAEVVQGTERQIIKLIKQ
jgi:5-methylthioadenosine/S-adenosylhomocysteine deaminase